MSSTLARTARQRLYGLGQAAIRRGLDPAWMGYRCMVHEDPRDWVRRHHGRAVRRETIHPQSVARHPLPRNVEAREELPGDAGWWGYAFRDVPARPSAETFLAELPDVRVVPTVDPMRREFWPALLTRDGRALALREMRFRRWHAEALRTAGPPVRLERATWILERVYDNHSHWLTAHLPKLVLLRERGALSDVLMPPRRTRVMDASMRLLGLDPDAFPTFDPSRPLHVDRLTLLGTDRFRPELLRSVRAAIAPPDAPTPRRRLYISRARAPRRRLLNEDAVWPLLHEAGFERVFMEDHPFDRQVRLMQEAAAVVAPHGAGLTNILFCRPGTHVVEIADLGFPNPNFYALAAAMDLPYWIVPADSVGDRHPLEKDLHVAPEAVAGVLDRLPA